TIHTSDDPTTVIAQRLLALLQRPAPTYIALSGGSTPRPLYTLLATELCDQIPWDRVTLFQVDERMLPWDHPDSNWKMSHESLVARVPNLTAYPMDPMSANPADDYAARLRNTIPHNNGGVPVFDLLILGMGADGHTASLFPNTPALDVQDRLVTESGGPPPHTRRLTLTFPVLRAAARRWFLVQGADKAKAFHQAQHAQVPAGQIGDAEWFLDRSVID
ncbi:MAG: 6-phosphogluconolactonase, partial [FCB group bacterium]|nr:6-phosphogluconolactonase [FCB group bacterium]